ncbi:MAG: hypothetical protein RLZZ502_491 [Pseudomonadota bacterium]
MKTIPLLACLPLVIISACSTTVPSVPARTAMKCDEGLKSYRPDTNTKVLLVRHIKKGEKIMLVDAATPVTTADDICLVKLLVGPGATREPDKTARSYSEGIGIEVWLPSHAQWNGRIRDYGGGGWVGGGHRNLDKYGSKVPAVINANMGYVSATTDAGNPHYQDGSFAFLSTGEVNTESMRDFTHRSLVEQAMKSRELAQLYYGKPHKYAYFDGHSQGGRQALKLAQDYPELYDGFLVAQAAVSVTRFGLAGMYTQVVMKTELGFNALDKDKTAALAKKFAFVNAHAVSRCDRAGLGFLLDPAACDYSPSTDPEALCAGVHSGNFSGANTDKSICLSAKEAAVIDRIWYGPSVDGQVREQTAADRDGVNLASNQLWWAFHRGSHIGSISGASADQLAMAMQDVTYLTSFAAGGQAKLQNNASALRDRWSELTYQSYADAYRLAHTRGYFKDYVTDKADLSKLKKLGRKIIMHNGLAEDAIPAAGAVNYYQRVRAEMGGDLGVQQFLRMYQIPGMAHSSQGRAWTVSGKNNSVPMPLMPGNNNQTPSREQDQMFTALVDWVERGIAPDDILIRSRDNTLSYPICVYPKKITWSGGPVSSAQSFSCR